ncbi:DUF2061 domain-containing protein [Candidatus Bathyarchaeota archaeon]|nr:DUF2061 domain-containing protein [Candidatus Bathyarchaeota archaeon]
MMDSKIRSIIKSLTRRAFALLITVIISFAILDNWETSLLIGVASNLLKTIFYYVHEKVWNRIRWGRIG